jgi:hypothetical protein
MNRKLFPTAATFLLLSAVTASATAIFDPTTKACTARNCGAVQFGGTVSGFLSSPMPWTIQVFADAQECLRLEVTSQDTDLEMRVVAPDGSKSWISDDSGLAPCPTCSLVAIDTRQRNGWYTVHIGEYVGQSVLANFTLAYGRYLRGNANCTTPAVGPASTVDKNSDSPAPDPRFAPGR